jgi:histidine triad (HIT) family protein
LPSPRDDCLFCQLVRDGSHVAKTKGFVAINDINPKAPVHLLIIPEGHVDTFREIGEFSARETKRMLEFVADTARAVGLSDYRVVVNVGPKAGQMVFHLHWHVLGSREPDAEMAAELATTAVTEL